MSFLELAKQAIERIQEAPDCDPLAGQSLEAECDLLYAEHFEALIERMRADPMPADCLPWLAENHAGLHRLLTVALPDKLQEVWDAPGFHLPAFEWVLDRIWDAHRETRRLYSQRIPKASLVIFGTPSGDGDAK